MATPLRYALIFLLWAMIAVIYAPLIGSSHADIACFVVDALAGVICRSTVTAGITGDAGVDNHCGGRGVVDCPAGDCGAVAGPKWQRMCARLPWLLAIPHVAFATSALLLFADGGLLYDYFRISLRQWTNWVLGWASPRR